MVRGTCEVTFAFDNWISESDGLQFDINPSSKSASCPGAPGRYIVLYYDDIEGRCRVYVLN